MEIWVAAVLAVIFLAVGTLSLRLGVKSGKRAWKITGIVLLSACFMCALYLIASGLLIDGIK